MSELKTNLRDPSYDKNYLSDRSFTIAGARVNALNQQEWTDFVADAIRERRRAIICSQNLHSMFLLQRHSGLASLQASAYVRIDGMPVVWLGRLLGHDLDPSHRLTWVDWFPVLMATAEREGWRVFFLGSEGSVVQRASEILQERYPTLRLKMSAGYFNVRSDSYENEAKLREMNDFSPDLLIVGMGMPRQEQWILDNHHAVNGTVIATAGGIIEYVSGAVRTPPRWMGRIGLEWLFRLIERPSKFWNRYLIEPWHLVLPVFRAWKGKER